MQACCLFAQFDFGTKDRFINVINIPKDDILLQGNRSRQIRSNDAATPKCLATIKFCKRLV